MVERSGVRRIPFRVMTFAIGAHELSAPVVLAPMAGVTNAPFREMCRKFAPGLVYVNEMAMATPVVHKNAKTERMISFGPGEQPRSQQLYGSDPEIMGKAVHILCDAGGASTTSTSTSGARPPRSPARAAARQCRLDPSCSARLSARR